MSNPYLTNLAELRQLEARLDQRLELIQKAEVNLKGLFEALRTQVSGAYPVLDELKKLLPQARERIDESRLTDSLNQTADSIATSMTERLCEAIDQAKQEIDAFAGPVRQQMIDDLRAVVQAAKSSIESIQPQIPESAEATDSLNQMADGFRIEVRRTIDALKQSMLDQVDLLRAEAQVQVDPILDQIITSRDSAQQQIEGVVAAHEESMQRRIQQLTRSVEEISATLEERLTQRIASIRRRADEAMVDVETNLRSQTDVVMGTSHAYVSSGEAKLVSRLDFVQPRVEERIAEMDRQIMDRMQRMEQHAEAMSAYLEQKLTSQVDELIHRLRLKLQHEIAAVSGAPAPVTRITHPDAPARPKVEVFVNKNVTTPQSESAEAA